MRKYETIKLFWGKYMYKLAIQNRIGAIFRNKNLSYARQVLDDMQRDYEAGNPLKITRYRRCDFVKESHFLDAGKLYKFLSRTNEYMLRVESFTTCIYSNNRDWLHSLKSSLHKENLIEFWEPDPKQLSLLQTDTILINRPFPYQFKVTLGVGTLSTEGFAKWSKSNPKQIKLGPVLKEELIKNGYVNGMYFYARDEKTLQLCSLMLDNIRRIDKIVTKHIIDK